MTIIISRRMALTAGIGALAGLGSSARGADRLKLTPEQQLGPFYPVSRPLDQDADLTRVRGMRGLAKGQIVEVSGVVRDQGGRVVPGARIDLWQANALGRYAHPGDARSDIPLDADFQGSAIVTADTEGRYRFRTIKPGAYPIGGGRVRTPHIHVDITGRTQRLTTQIYFPDEAMNAADIVYPKDAGEAATLTLVPAGPVSGVEGALAFRWDIVLLTS